MAGESSIAARLAPRFPETATKLGAGTAPPRTLRPWKRTAMTWRSIGGGAAGLSAALVLGRARRRVAVIDAGSPRNAPAAHMQGFLSRDGIPPGELLALGREEVVGYGVDDHRRQRARASRAGARRSASRCATAARSPRAGCSSRPACATSSPTSPGLRERWARDVLHCPYCHGWEVRDQPARRARRFAGSRPLRPDRPPVVRRPRLLHAGRDACGQPSEQQLAARGHRRRRGRAAAGRRRGRPAPRRRARRRSRRRLRRAVRPAALRPLERAARRPRLRPRRGRLAGRRRRRPDERRRRLGGRQRHEPARPGHHGRRRRICRRHRNQRRPRRGGRARRRLRSRPYFDHSPQRIRTPKGGSR